MVCRGVVTMQTDGSVRCSTPECRCQDLETAAMAHGVFFFAPQERRAWPP